MGVLGRNHARVDADAPLHRDVGLEVISKGRRHKHEQADGLEPALAADHRAPVAEILETLEGQAGLRFVGVVHPHQGPALAGCPGRDVALLDHDDTFHTRLGQVKRGTQAVHACANHYNVCRLHVFSLC